VGGVVSDAEPAAVADEDAPDAARFMVVVGGGVLPMRNI
jgi:hypothetical protein